MGLCYYGFSAIVQLSNGECLQWVTAPPAWRSTSTTLPSRSKDMDEALDMYASLFGLDPSEVEDVAWTRVSGRRC